MELERPEFYAFSGRENTDHLSITLFPGGPAERSGYQTHLSPDACWGAYSKTRLWIEDGTRRDYIRKDNGLLELGPNGEQRFFKRWNPY